METAFDQRTFRNALGQFLTGVTVITLAGQDGQPLGFTANSFTSVSLEPPMVLVCLDKKSTSYEAALSAEGYAVHMLGADQIELSSRFAAKGGDKFADLDYTKGLYDAPLLSGTLAVLECRTVQKVVAGDHVVLIGQVERIDCGSTERQPLGFLRGRYVTSAS